MGDHYEMQKKKKKNIKNKIKNKTKTNTTTIPFQKQTKARIGLGSMMSGSTTVNIHRPRDTVFLLGIVRNHMAMGRIVLPCNHGIHLKLNGAPRLVLTPITLYAKFPSQLSFHHFPAFQVRMKLYSSIILTAVYSF